MSKRGQLVASRTVKTVIIVIGFAILLGFLALIFGIFQENIGDDACRLSVITRATAPDEFQGTLPLKCPTKKICFKSGRFGDCEQFAGEKEVREVSLSGTPEQKARKIEEVSAEAMFNCWNLMGQGKLDLFGGFWKGLGLSGSTGDTTCVVCSRLAIDKDISEEEFNKILQNVDLVGYLRNNQVPGRSETYLQTFTDKSVQGYPKVTDNTFSGAIEELEKLSNDKTKVIGDLDGRQMAFVFMQIKTQDYIETFSKLGNYGFAVAGGAFVSGPIVRKLILNPVVLKVAAVAAIVGTAVVANNVYEGREAAAGYCGEFSTNDESARQGCSIVQAIPYTFQDIDKLCTTIQSTP